VRRKELKDYWTATDINRMNTCPRKYFYSVVKKVRTATSGDMARGVFMHRRIETFFKPDKKNPKQMIPVYKSAKAWANVAANWWQQGAIKNSRSRGQVIDWKFDQEPYILKNSIRETCLASYDFLAEQGPPILAEYRFAFSVVAPEFQFLKNGIKFKGIIDDIRDSEKPDMLKLIRDYKTGWSRIKDTDAEHGYQLTLYGLAFCTLCNKDDGFREAVGIPKELAALWGGNPILISDKIEVELNQTLNWDKDRKYMPYELSSSLDKVLKRHGESMMDELRSELVEIMAEYKKKILPPGEHRSTRNDTNISELFNLVDWFELVRSTGEYWPIRGSHCSWCEHKKMCDKDTLEKKPTTCGVQLDLFKKFIPPRSKGINQVRQRHLKFTESIEV